MQPSADFIQNVRPRKRKAKQLMQMRSHFVRRTRRVQHHSDAEVC